MALHMERLAAPPTGGVDAQRAFMHRPGSTLAAPRHPGKYVLASSPDTSSGSEDEGEGGGQAEGASPGAEAATTTPFSLGHATHHHPSNHHHHNHQAHWGPAHGPGGGEQHGEDGEKGGGPGGPKSREQLIRGAPYPHRWPSRKRRKCRSLGYLAVHAPTLTEEEVVVRPSSLAAAPLADAGTLGPALGPGAELAQHGTARSLFMHQDLPAAPSQPRQNSYFEVEPHPPPPQQRPQPQPQPPPPPQRQQPQPQPQRSPPGKPPGKPPPPAAPAPAPLPPQRMAGAPRALQKPMQLAAGATGKAGQLPRGQSGGAGGERRGAAAQPSAKKARTSGPAAGPAAAGGSGGGGGAAGKQPGKQLGGKPPGKPPYKPSPSPQPPVRRPSSVTLDRQRSSSVPPPPGGAAGPRPPSGQGPAGLAALAGPGGGYRASMAVAGSDFPPGHLVWAKLPSYPWWPAQVQAPQPNHLNIKHGPADLFVVFYGTADVSWVPGKDVKHFSPALPDYTKHAAVRNKGLQKAIDEAWVALGRPRPDVNGKPHDG